MASNRTFNAPWSLSTWIITLLFTTIVFGIVPWLYTSHISQTNQSYPSSIAILLIGPAIFIIAALFAPRKYIITDKQIIVRRLGSDLIIPFGNIINTSYIHRKELKTTYRIFGVGGFMGMYGTYRSSAIGPFTMAATNTSNLILIECINSNKLIISPDTPQEFLNSLSLLKSTNT